jgi:hypothetical protein
MLHSGLDNTSSKSSLTSKTFQIAENQNYITQSQNDFFSSDKIFFKPAVNAITAKNINKGSLMTGTVPNSPLHVNRNKFY